MIDSFKRLIKDAKEIYVELIINVHPILGALFTLLLAILALSVLILFVLLVPSIIMSLKSWVTWVIIGAFILCFIMVKNIKDKFGEEYGE